MLPRANGLVNAGNLYIAAGDRVRKISPDGVITIAAGGGTLCCSGSDGRLATDAKLFLLCGGPAVEDDPYAGRM
jgi:hypothetical protein